MAAEPHLLLVGAGHAHLHLLRHLSRLTDAGYRVTLVAPRWFSYSGMASAVAAGARDPDASRIDVRALTSGRARHLEDTVTDVDLPARTVTTSAGVTVAWDVLSLNIGSVASVPPGLQVDDSVVRVKPLTDLAALSDHLQQAPGPTGRKVSIVGAGPSGVELAGHLAARCDVDHVVLVDRAPLGQGLPSGAAAALTREMTRRGVLLCTGTQVAAVTADAVLLADDTRIPHDIAVLATGLTAPPLAVSPDLGGPQGIPVRATLQHRDHDEVYATGDCADFLPEPLTRVGVHGVRQGPVLLAGLEARRHVGPAPVYRPQRRMLSIIDLGQGSALAVRGSWWWLGRSSLLLKRVIDRRWLRTHRTSK